MSILFNSLREYLYPGSGPKTFVIPNYQRGYKWSVREGNNPTSVEDFMDRLISAWKNNPSQNYFLQGVTVVEEGDKIILIDGQQRTTTLYLLLGCIGKENISGHREIRLDYSIREKSRDFIKRFSAVDFDWEGYDQEDKIQDIHYFKEAIIQINKYLPDPEEKLERKTLLEYILDKIRLLYIVIPAEKAINTFTMMNGHKAKMHEEELIKAEMLHLVSLPEEVKDIPEVKTVDDSYAILKEIVSTDWETNSLRSKYAREWDKWLYWWNRTDVKEFFGVDKPMGLLLEYYFHQKGYSGDFTFRNFRQLLRDGDKKSAKDVFKGLRDLQKGFEDLFNDPLIFNSLKMALIGAAGDGEDKYDVIIYFLSHKRDYNLLQDYAKWRIAGATHKEYTSDKNSDERAHMNDRAQQMVRNLSSARVWGPASDEAFRQLLRLNVEQYNMLNNGKGIKFDFSVWGQKSLEHIYPKSKFFHIEEVQETDGTITRRFMRGDDSDISEEDSKGLINSKEAFSNPNRYSEHCIGNLVLLYGNNNSEFGAKSFQEKKRLFFENKRVFESRNLLHTISAFANDGWDIRDIEQKADKFISDLKKDYNIQEEDNDNE